MRPPRPHHNAGKMVMEECKQCDLAIYCYSEPASWIFRTKQEMDEKRAEMEQCPVHEQVAVMKGGEQISSTKAQAG